MLIKIKKDNKGVISIYLCLILAVIIPILLMIIDIVRFKAIQVRTQNVSDMAADSLLAEYDKDLLEDYGLLFIDTSYSNDIGNLDYSLKRFKDYADYNLNTNKELAIYGAKDMYGLSLDDVEVVKVSRATDNKGEVFRYMAESYMLDKYGYAYVEGVQNLMNTYDSLNLSDIDIVKDSDKADKDVQDYIPPDQEGVEWEEVEKEDPVPGVSLIKKKGILDMVLDKPVSDKIVNLNEYASKRNLINGDGLWEALEERNDILDLFLFNEYILQELGNYRNIINKDDNSLKYQVEYVLGGLSSDKANLERVAQKLLLIRGAANTLYFLQDFEKQMEAKEAADFLAGLCLCPPLSAVFQVAIEAGWIYAESLYDVKKVFHGKPESLVTTRDSWDLTYASAIDNILDTFGITMSDDKSDQLSDNKEPSNRDGLYYEDYLRILLYLTGRDAKTMRCIDVVEMNIRNKQGRENFRMDDCVASMTLQTIYKSSYGYEILYTKEFGYK